MAIEAAGLGDGGVGVGVGVIKIERASEHSSPTTVGRGRGLRHRLVTLAVTKAVAVRIPSLFLGSQACPCLMIRGHQVLGLRLLPATVPANLLDAAQ